MCVRSGASTGSATCRQAGVGEQRAVARRVARAAPSLHAGEVRQLHAQHRGLQRVEAEVGADQVMVVLRLHAVIANQPQLVRQRRVGRGDEAAVAERAEVLAREEREAADRAPCCRPAGRDTCSRSPAPRPRSPAMPRCVGRVEDRRQLGRLAEQVHRDDRLGARRDRRDRRRRRRC